MKYARAITLGEDHGLIKTTCDANAGLVIGGHAVGAEVSALIQSCVIAIRLQTHTGTSAEQLTQPPK